MCTRILCGTALTGAVLATFACQPTTTGPRATPDASATLAASAAPQPTTTTTVAPPPESATTDGGTKPDVPPVKAEDAPSAAPRLGNTPPLKKIADAIPAHFGRSPTRNLYIQLDKPIYKPGETIWLKTWNLRMQKLAGDEGESGLHYQLVSPKGSVVLQKRVKQAAGLATNDFELPADVQGGEYTLKVLSDDGGAAERTVVVSTYEPPRIKKKLEFVRKAYGAGDEVTATLELRRTTGEPMAKQAATAAIRLDGNDLPRVSLTTNAKGEGLVRFTLPAQIDTGDGLLTVLVEDGGITESISKRIPIIVRKLQFQFFPEGGQLVTGLPARVYFEAKNPLGKPADVEGRIIDDAGNAVASFRTHKDGLGRMAFTPGTGRSYKAQITRPVGVTETYPLPLAAEEGCTLRAYDDLDGQLPALRVGVACSQARTVHVVAVQRDELLDQASLKVTPGTEAVAWLEPKDAALKRRMGVARITLFDDDLQPQAERLVFRNRRDRLQVRVDAHKPGYSPRDQVVLTVSTTRPGGEPVPAELALSVVDDTVISFADDKTGHLLSRLFMEAELPGKVEEPNNFLDLTEEKSALALDLLMGTRGWRRFEWRPVFDPPKPAPSDALSALEGGGGPRGGMVLRKGDGERRERPMAVAAMPPPPAAAPAPPPRPAANMAPAKDVKAPEAPAPAQVPVMEKQVAKEEEAAPEKKRMAAGKIARGERDDMMADRLAAGAAVAEPDADWGGERKPQEWSWAPVRVFPVPDYQPGYDGPRTDFRETVAWMPQVRTGKDGKATVTFNVSDAITSFRVFAEGVGGGLAGRQEKVIDSRLPFSMSVKIPLEVSAGDKVLLPMTLTNERSDALAVSVDATFGPLLEMAGTAPQSEQKLAAQARQSMFYPLVVTGKQGHSDIRFVGQAAGLKDEFTRPMRVTPRGFPQKLAFSGEVKGKVSHVADLGAAVPGSVSALVKFYPSPVATMVSGLEGMLREPSGCFEQTSSTNYPNVMVLQYLKQQRVEEPALMERSARLLESGYKRLTGYESPNKGYEWFGGDPGHEALTAYGLVEFTDMREVYPDVDTGMIDRTAKWLLSRRDGKGGYQRDPKALDSFGRASEEVTAAYITWSLTEAGTTDLPAELEMMKRLAKDTQDGYLLALAAGALLNVPATKSLGVAAAGRLAGMQDGSGAWTRADHSITRSGGINLHIETTALAVLALLKAGGHRGNADKAMGWLTNNRGGFGEWGATQSTVLALKAMREYSRASSQTRSAGAVVVKVNGKTAGQQKFEAGHRGVLEIPVNAALFGPGKNTLELVNEGGEAMPYSVGLEFFSARPASSEQAQVNLVAALERTKLKMGETVRVNATVTNKTQNGLPMTLARIGLPGGLTFQNWQLKELREKGIIAFYETRPREVILYFRDMKPAQEVKVPIDLVATVPGEYEGPASSAYLYYNNEFKSWADPLGVSITP